MRVGGVNGRFEEGGSAFEKPFGLRDKVLFSGEEGLSEQQTILKGAGKSVMTRAFLGKKREELKLRGKKARREGGLLQKKNFWKRQHRTTHEDPRPLWEGGVRGLGKNRALSSCERKATKPLSRAKGGRRLLERTYVALSIPGKGNWRDPALRGVEVHLRGRGEHAEGSPLRKGGSNQRMASVHLRPKKEKKKGTRKGLKSQRKGELAARNGHRKRSPIQ